MEDVGPRVGLKGFLQLQSKDYWVKLFFADGWKDHRFLGGQPTLSPTVGLEVGG